MEFEFGNLIYLIFAIIAAIVGLMGKKKKPAKGGESQSGKPGFMENLEQMLKMGQDDPMVVDLHDYEQDIMPEEAEDETHIKAEPGTPSLMEEYHQLLGRRQEYQSEMIPDEGEYTDEPLEVIQLDEEEATDYFEIVKDFDAGTAVVYSAIINRVDY
jgi:hypothetical protein